MSNNLDHNSITGSILSVGAYVLSINQINAIASMLFMAISGVASVTTIYYNIKKIKNKNNEKS
jgi:NADH:ubiquinone oxidoreductase subunit E